jgi:integration host factor subunit beta
MTRAELIEQLSFKFPDLQFKDIDMAVRVILDAASTTLANGGRVEIRGFGSFGLNYKPPRNGRNPKTGEKVLVPAKYSPHFKPGKELRERVDFPKP